MYTIIIPTLERHKLLHRSISYYKNFPCEILVADSSQEEMKYNFPANVVYKHLPGLSYPKKILEVAKLVTTPYVVLTGDDDYFLKSALNEGVIFLNKNSDFVSVQGTYFKFEFIENHISISQKYSKESSSYSAVGNDISSRVIKAFNPYMHHFYAMHRTDVLIDSFRACTDTNYCYATEWVTILTSMCYGKHTTLPVLWLIRDSHKYFRPNVSMDSKKAPTNPILGFFEIHGHQQMLKEVDDFLKSKDGQLTKVKFGDVISDLVNDRAESNKIFKTAFKSFHDGLIKGRNKIIIKKIIKLFIPTWLLSYYKSKINNKIANLKQKNTSTENEINDIKLSIEAFPEIYNKL